MLRIIWNDREGYFGEQFDIAAKCCLCASIAFFLGMFVGCMMQQESWSNGYKAGLQHAQEMSK